MITHNSLENTLVTRMSKLQTAACLQYIHTHMGK